MEFFTNFSTCFCAICQWLKSNRLHTNGRMSIARCIHDIVIAPHAFASHIFNIHFQTIFFYNLASRFQYTAVMYRFSTMKFHLSQILYVVILEFHAVYWKTGILIVNFSQHIPVYWKHENSYCSFSSSNLCILKRRTCFVVFPPRYIIYWKQAL